MGPWTFVSKFSELFDLSDVGYASISNDAEDNVEDDEDEATQIPDTQVEQSLAPSQGSAVTSKNSNTPKRSRKSGKKDESEFSIEIEPVDALLNEAKKQYLFNGKKILSDWQGIADSKHLARERSKTHVQNLKKVCNNGTLKLTFLGNC